MALIIMACHDTEANGRSEYTEKTLKSLVKMVSYPRHRLVIVDNGSCKKTKNLIKGYQVITNEENIGTARAINQGLKLRRPEEYCIKIDNDVVVNQLFWPDMMEDAMNRDPSIGILGLKRKDVDWDGKYFALPHEPGQRWLTVEKGTYIMGTCTMFNWRLIDKIGGMKQPGLYGLDDTLYSLRSELSGFYNCYMPQIDLDHIDTGSNIYIQEKQQLASDVWPDYMAMHAGYIDGTRSLWEEFE